MSCMLKDIVEKLVAEVLQETDMFLVRLTVGANNEIKVLLDSDANLTLSDCKNVSRYIESNLDREDFDFSILVSSSGVGEPLIFRQYKKNIGRKVRVVLNDGTIMEAKMIDSNNTEVYLEWKSREKKLIGKGKHTVLNKRVVPIENIKEITVLITFN